MHQWNRLYTSTHPSKLTGFVWWCRRGNKDFKATALSQYAVCHAYFLLSVMYRWQMHFSPHFRQIKASKVFKQIWSLHSDLHNIWIKRSKALWGMWYDLFMKTSARGKQGNEWKPQANVWAEVETFVSVHLGWSTCGTSASMLGQTSPFQCCHFSSLPSVSSVLSQPILPSSLASYPLPPNSLWIVPSLYRLLSGILRSTAMHPCAPPQWPRMTSTFHLTLGNLLTKDFCFFFSFPLSFGFVDFFPLFLSSFSNSPSFSVCILFIFDFLPCQVAVSSTSICIRCCSKCPHP